MQGRINTRQLGFTLAEIMISLLIFLMISGAMLTIFSTATDLYRVGEAGRRAADHSYTVLNLLRDDLDVALSPGAGGQFYAEHSDGDASAWCAVGWTIRNRDARRNADQRDRRLFVFWGINNAGNLARVTVPVNDDGSPIQDNAQALLNGSGSIIAEEVMPNCLHFSAWLIGGSSGGFPNIISKTPVHANSTVDWEHMWNSEGEIDATEPAKGYPYRTYRKYNPADTSFPLYPAAVRFTIVSAGPETLRQKGYLVSIGDDLVRTRGLTKVPLRDGGLLRIGSDAHNCEWVSVSGRTDEGWLVTKPGEGLVRFEADEDTVTAKSGRGVLRSGQGTWTDNPEVSTGRLLSYVHSFSP